MHSYLQAVRQAGRQAGSQAGWQAGSQAARQASKEVGRQERELPCIHAFKGAQVPFEGTQVVSGGTVQRAAKGKPHTKAHKITNVAGFPILPPPQRESMQRIEGMDCLCGRWTTVGLL